jgi:AraC family transcriptional regulator of arabinose operon/AraC family L-rhamnose operon transcriptional activator RhaR
MYDEIISQARMLPQVHNFFVGNDLPTGFNIPNSILIFCHDADWSQPILSSRCMLIIPLAEMTYLVESRDYLISPGQALLVNPYLHRTVTSKNNYSLRLIISFKIDGQQTYLPKSPLMKLNNVARDLIKTLLDKYLQGQIIPVMCYLTMLLDELSKHQLEPRHKELTYYVQKALPYMNQYPEKTLSVKDIANYLGISESHLRRQFRHEMGESIGGYLSNIRLNTAKRLLADTDLSIEAVGNQCGYDSIYSFSRFFKKSIGVSPLRFRKQNKNVKQI